MALLEVRTHFHLDALTATQSADNAATRDLLQKIGRLLAEEGVPAALRDALALDHLAKMLEAQAETLAFQDGFRLLALVFIAALIPAWNLGRTSGKPHPAP